ncbi:MAG: CopD family protein [Chloroflexota bacterium]
MDTPPIWALTLVYWLHMLATVAWIGGIVSISILVLPAAHKSLKPADLLAFIEAIQKRLEPLAWFSLGLLIATGLFQLSANSHYNGFFDVSTQWSLAILIKHGLVVVMVVVSAVQTWEVLPAIRRTLMRRDKGASEEEIVKLQTREERLLRMNFILSILILGATALARAA